jgi:hypothetical protein
MRVSQPGEHAALMTTQKIASGVDADTGRRFHIVVRTDSSIIVLRSCGNNIFKLATHVQYVIL